ncbi:Protein CBG00192 [Caenorhabditis briggsae]|nr:Protein CBG00192 [Caenorhabditis briggsae]ULT83614.1 hypothetical protein L3Y34_012683 [Caenorhabditis briggsae]UMM42879.1 hypothetical protein L5515_018539 [Caenorhabditis briggsae]CAP21665.1 Protein CBG00192 [Caenorhabditis briggsae]
MDAMDLFGGLSSDEEEENYPPTPKDSTLTLMAEMEMSDEDGDEPMEANDTDKTTSGSSPDQMVPATFSDKPTTSAQVKFFLSSDEDSMDMPDVKQMVKDSISRLEQETKRKLMEAVEATKPITCMEPLVKKPKVEIEDLMIEQLPTVPEPMPMTSDVESVPQGKMDKKDIESVRIKSAVKQEEEKEEDNTAGKLDHDEKERLKMEVLLKNFSKEQFDRYEVFRQSKFQRTMIRRLMKKFTNNAPFPEGAVIAVASLAKMVVGDIVEEALDIRDAKEDEAEQPLQPHHIRQAYYKLAREGTIHF